jgi:hypothetical protein
MTTNGYVLAKVVSFLFNKNIDIIPDIYRGKLESHLVAHLMDKARSCREQHNDNTLGWVDFIMSLDQSNLSILEEYIFSN